MAKRTTPRSQADDTSTEAPPRPTTRRSKPAASMAPPADTLGVYTGVERTEGRSNAPVERTGSHGNEPSEEAIRDRAYQRYLERGSRGGSDVEDWIEAERELKSSKA